MNAPIQDPAALLPIPAGGLATLTLLDLPGSTFLQMVALDRGTAYGPIAFEEASQIVPLGGGFGISGGGPLNALRAHEPILIPAQKAFTLEATAPGHLLVLRFRGLAAPEEAHEACSYRCSEHAAAGPAGPVEHPLLRQWMEEHDEALHRLTRLEVALQAGDFSAAEPEARWLGAELKSHNEAEEALLFPHLDPYFGDHSPVSCMRDEHRTLWDLVLALGRALDQQDGEGARAAGLQAVVLLRNHIAKENNVLYPMAERLLSDEVKALLGRDLQEA